MPARDRRASPERDCVPAAQMVRGEACGGDQPGRHGVRVPHLARLELVASPHRRRDCRGEIQQPAGGAGEPAAAVSIAPKTPGSSAARHPDWHTRRLRVARSLPHGEPVYDALSLDEDLELIDKIVREPCARSSCSCTPAIPMHQGGIQARRLRAPQAIASSSTSPPPSSTVTAYSGGNPTHPRSCPRRSAAEP